MTSRRFPDDAIDADHGSVVEFEVVVGDCLVLCPAVFETRGRLEDRVSRLSDRVVIMSDQ